MEKSSSLGGPQVPTVNGQMPNAVAGTESQVMSDATTDKVEQVANQVDQAGQLASSASAAFLDDKDCASKDADNDIRTQTVSSEKLTDAIHAQLFDVTEKLEDTHASFVSGPAAASKPSGAWFPGASAWVPGASLFPDNPGASLFPGGQDNELRKVANDLQTMFEGLQTQPMLNLFKTPTKFEDVCATYYGYEVSPGMVYEAMEVLSRSPSFWERSQSNVGIPRVRNWETRAKVPVIWLLNGIAIIVFVTLGLVSLFQRPPQAIDGVDLCSGDKKSAEIMHPHGIHFLECKGLNLLAYIFYLDRILSLEEMFGGGAPISLSDGGDGSVHAFTKAADCHDTFRLKQAVQPTWCALRDNLARHVCEKDVRGARQNRREEASRLSAACIEVLVQKCCMEDDKQRHGMRRQFRHLCAAVLSRSEELQEEMNVAVWAAQRERETAKRQALAAAIKAQEGAQLKQIASPLKMAQKKSVANIEAKLKELDALGKTVQTSIAAFATSGEAEAARQAVRAQRALLAAKVAGVRTLIDEDWTLMDTTRTRAKSEGDLTEGMNAMDITWPFGVSKRLRPDNWDSMVKGKMDKYCNRMQKWVDWMNANEDTNTDLESIFSDEDDDDAERLKNITVEARQPTNDEDGISNDEDNDNTNRLRDV